MKALAQLETITQVKAPFPWFGGKSRAASLVWARFGDVPNYVEPFAGSLAVLLARPTAPNYETVNDKDFYLANFWRAVSIDPEAVAAAADWPVNEIDLHARHRWLLEQSSFREKMLADPEYYDAKIAGFWAWGVSAWIGHAWCERVDNPEKAKKSLPHLGTGQGINTKRARDLSAYFLAIQSRLRRVRVACGDWSRVCGCASTINNGLTGVFLDPPYSVSRSQKYNEDAPGLSSEVREWALARGDDPKFRIALCGYEGEHDMPGSWECVPWKAHCGYGWRVGDGRQNRHRERIWFSPHCLKPDMQLRVVESL